MKSFDDLKLFGLFEDEWLRGGPVRRWVPKGLQGQAVYVFETGGTTGIPKSRVVVDDFRIDYEMFSDTLPDKYLPQGTNWLMLGPSGPRRLRLAVEHLVPVSAAASASASTSIRAGSSSSSRRAGWSTSRPTRNTSSIRR